ncbi:6739_t:CDS:2 [Racocetra fulgida]|uniref:6739_t:CDS:1 n=1 Tax=Racocetra fulgida TaxID=60492 RepID=A0A9N9G916_9GLOM|nr:6739_t:CDS:2 [Racocetra fulgida]
MNEQIIEIPSEKKITKIVCSPKLKYIAAWSDEDMSACIFSIEDQMNLKYEGCYSLKEQIKHGLSKEIEYLDFLNAEKYDLKLSDQRHITKNIQIRLKESYLINYSVVFSIDNSKLEVQQKSKTYFPYLPPSEFGCDTKNCKKHDFNELMIEDYNNSRFKLSLYGEYLMEHLLEKENFESIENLLKNIIDFTIKNSDENFISNLPLMKIVTYNFESLSQYPEIINWFLSRIAFFVSDNTLSKIIDTNSTSNHLQKFGKYPNISNIF